jgi:uncharacterized protein YdhG (YjbR/CyaY superfamily)
MKKPANVDAYIASFPPEVQHLLQQIRAVIRQVAPSAEEVISYGIPAYRLQGMLVWFAAHTNFISLYPRGSGIEEFKDELTGYKVSKGTIQFPLGKPLPLGLIKQIVEFRVIQNLERKR